MQPASPRLSAAHCKTPLQILNELVSNTALTAQWESVCEAEQHFRSRVCICGVDFGWGDCVLGKRASRQDTARMALRDARLLHIITAAQG